MPIRGESFGPALFATTIALAWLFPPSPSPAQTMDFESVPPGTTWGVGTQSPGDPVLSEGNIMMSVETFFFTQSNTEFFRAEVPLAGNPISGTFPTQELSLDGISVDFDFTGLGFGVNVVSLEFVDAGGTSNFGVNGMPIHILNPLSSLPAIVAPGISAMFQGNTLTVDAGDQSITSLLIGGQELVIDNVRAVPEPAAGMLLLLGLAAGLRRRR